MISRRDRFSDAAAAATDRRAGFYQSYVLRPLSLPLTPAFLRAGISANQATAIGALVGIAAAATAAAGTYEALLGAAFVRHFAVVMDFVDGNLARAHGLKTWAGKYFDGLTDALLDGLFVIGVGVGLGGGYPTAACFAAWMYGAGQYARMRLLYVDGVYARTSAPPAAVPGVPPFAHAGLARRALAAFDRFDREVTLPLLIPAAVIGRMDLWAVLACVVRGTGGILNLAGAVYRAAVVLNIRRA